MRDYFASGRAVDVILVIVAIETVALLAWRRSGLGLADVVGLLLAGGLLLGALRCALTGSDYRWTALFLTASLPAHVFDLQRRIRARS